MQNTDELEAIKARVEAAKQKQKEAVRAQNEALERRKQADFELDEAIQAMSDYIKRLKGEA